ncbi:MAG: toprim domain-containing protein, partial [Flavobacteriales bacterium]
MELPSRLLEAAVDRIASLPGIGRKTALRLALHLLRSDAERVHGLARALTDMRDGVRPCRVCHTATEGAECSVCADPARPEHLICLVEDLRDQLAIEALGSFRGRYHVLGGLISPMDGVGPADLHVTSLEERLRALPEGTEVEVIFALP